MISPIVQLDRVRQLLQQVTDFLGEWNEPRPAFTFQLGWSDNYDDLLQERFKAVSGADEILKRGLKSGRVLISARGGAAKTTVVYRLMRELLRSGEAIPILINLREWKAPYYDEWKSCHEDFSSKLNMLLERVGKPKLNVAVLASIDPDTLKVLVIDGLDEIVPSVAQEIISVADEYVRRAPQSIAIITDRIVRRTFREKSGWQLCSLKPLSDSEIRHQLAAMPQKLEIFEEAQPLERQLLSSPLFLDHFLKTERPAAGQLLTTAAELAYYFRQQLRLSDDELKASGRAAFAMYREARARTFPLARFREIAGPEATEKLSLAGTLIIRGETAYFHHHLHHDHLASLHLAEDKSEWRQVGFDAISFKAGSFDAIALTLEQLVQPVIADEFIQKLYDWNVYAPAYALAETHHGGTVTVSKPMQSVMYAMLAEKKWDFLLPSAERARDALALFPKTSEAKIFLDLDSPAAVRDYVKQLTFGDARFERWKDVFTIDSDSSVDLELCKEIISSDSIIGWTLANVLKRTKLTQSQQGSLRQWAMHSKEEAVVWRIAHVAGAFPTIDNVKFLLALLDREQMPWARYGALRSLVELAARSRNADLTADVFRALIRRLDWLSSKELLPELARAIFVQDPPATWAQHSLSLIDVIYNKQREEEGRKLWMRTAQRISKMYAADQPRAI